MDAWNKPRCLGDFVGCAVCFCLVGWDLDYKVWVVVVVFYFYFLELMRFVYFLVESIFFGVMYS